MWIHFSLRCGNFAVERTCLVVDLVVGEAAGQQLVENNAESVHVALECVGAVVHHAYHCGHHTKRDVILKGLSREIDFINFDKKLQNLA